MIECVFTLDYEIYGNGTGWLQGLVYEPANALASLFRSWDARFVAFIEAAELDKIEEYGSDSAIAKTKAQVRELYREGLEIGLHLHPQWCNARYEQGQWILDYTEYNFCTLSRPRIAEIVGGALRYLRYVLDEPGFTPLSFRAGNWLLQPTQPAAGILAENGIRIDSSVFKGGLQHGNGLDYRRALKNAYSWNFEADVNECNPTGSLTEVPIYTEMVPCWRMLTEKRVKAGTGLGNGGGRMQRLQRVRDFLRLRYPLKLDFCRMTLDELTSMMSKVIADDQRSPGVYKPIVAIGHTKDFSDMAAVDGFLSFLAWKEIPVVTFHRVLQRLSSQSSWAPTLRRTA